LRRRQLIAPRLQKLWHDLDHATAPWNFVAAAKSPRLFAKATKKSWMVGHTVMHTASKIMGFVCLILTIVLWAVTLLTDLTPGTIGTAAALTGIVAVTGALSLQYRS
jgi:hypothetical protein